MHYTRRLDEVKNGIWIEHGNKKFTYTLVGQSYQNANEVG